MEVKSEVCDLPSEPQQRTSSCFIARCSTEQSCMLIVRNTRLGAAFVSATIAINPSPSRALATNAMVRSAVPPLPLGSHLPYPCSSPTYSLKEHQTSSALHMLRTVYDWAHSSRRTSHTCLPT